MVEGNSFVGWEGWGCWGGWEVWVSVGMDIGSNVGGLGGVVSLVGWIGLGC